MPSPEEHSILDRRLIELPARSPWLRLALVAAAAQLVACTSNDGLLSSRIDYRSEAAKTPGLDVPPDLTQLAREGRYAPQSSVVTASGIAAAGASSSAEATPATVALNKLGDAKLARDGNQRWLVVPRSPEQLWPQLQSFWRANGFALSVDNATAGFMETGWAENRARLPQDFVRRTLGRLIDNLYDTGVRDSFRTRLERTEDGTEIYIMHRGVTEEFADAQRERTVWRTAPNDPQLEAEFLSRLMIHLGSSAAAAEQVRVEAAAQPSRPAAPVMASGASSLQINEPFERAYRSVGIALDRAGYTVEDRDRSAGLYFVRIIPTGPGNEDKSIIQRLFSSDDAAKARRYRVLVQEVNSQRSNVSVQNAEGQPETGEAAQRIISLMAPHLR
jgi:outer membrane protein assembly factor BamC